jgi:hypothetical protein
MGVAPGLEPGAAPRGAGKRWAVPIEIQHRAAGRGARGELKDTAVSELARSYNVSMTTISRADGVNEIRLTSERGGRTMTVTFNLLLSALPH